MCITGQSGYVITFEESIKPLIKQTKVRSVNLINNINKIYVCKAFRSYKRDTNNSSLGRWIVIYNETKYSIITAVWWS
jgi:hypothetical protein